ncbi:MAG: hypothetical protein K8F36_01585 [Melioribacteraceae bacterium]|nr:hypothetical protein [Melioribacteraceae bacterium]
MSKSFFSSLLILIILSSSVILAQGSKSIQLNGGIISPKSSTDGFSTAVQFNFNQNATISFYASVGYSSWNKFYVNFIEEWSPIQKETHFKTHISDEHIMIPLYFGSKVNFHTNKYFTSFINIELGYSYLKYNSYDYWRSINPETGEVLGYYPDSSTKEEIKDNIIGLGVGLGISHPMSSNMNLILSVKLNSNIYSKYSDMFNSRETYMSFLAGFSFNI